MLSEATLRLDRAKDTYLHALAQIDHLLKVAVASDPKVLKDARAIQQSYADLAIEPLELKALEQPVDAEPSAEPSKKPSKTSK